MTRDGGITLVPMTIDEYQRSPRARIIRRLTRDQRLLDASAGLAEEAGEVLGLVRKHLFMGHSIDVARLVTSWGTRSGA